jgi:spore maturation protein CgeB
MNITYIGHAHGSSLHRIKAFERLGHNISVIDPWNWLGNSKFITYWIYYGGGIGFWMLLDNRLIYEVQKSRPDIIWVNQGEFLGPNCIKLLRSLNVPIVNQISDDPFGGRDKNRFFQFKKALPFYDLLVVRRKINISEAKSYGARHVVFKWLSADEIAHAPRILTYNEQQNFCSQVAFIGTWMPERGKFMTELIEREIPVSIWGSRWTKAPEWKQIKPHWRGPSMYDDESYSAVILASRICLGLLSKGNRDLHTRRSIEIPSLGSLLCGERTSEHQTLYKENTEAVFWSNSEECANICKELLADEKLRTEIANMGHERAIQNNLFNEPILESILKIAFST